MGTLKDKLDYLEETKRLLREELNKAGATITDEDTFRSYVEKVADASGCGYITNAFLHAYNGTPEQTVITDLMGDYSATSNAAYFPAIRYPDLKSEDGSLIEAVVPFGARGVGETASPNTVLSQGYYNFSRIKATKNYKVKVFLRYVRPATLVLPDRVDLVRNTLINGNGVDRYTFTRGLAFGQSVVDSVSSWLYTTLLSTSARRVVKFPPGFKMDSGGNLYLSKIYITSECMKEMVQNLYDYIGNADFDGVYRVITVGTNNYNLLTSTEVQTAKDKGWNIVK